MAWFQKLCRNTGLMIHHVTSSGRSKQTVRHEVEEEQRGNITLRRTTIEEVEIRSEPNGTK